jgi:hypothetical protein
MVHTRTGFAIKHMQARDLMVRSPDRRHIGIVRVDPAAEGVSHRIFWPEAPVSMGSAIETSLASYVHMSWLYLDVA